MSQETIIKNKITWLSILQGWGMLLVVIGHSELAQHENIAWVDVLYRIIYSFHMPLFIFISGYLFYLTRIARQKSYGYVVRDKLLRLGVPLVCFTMIGIIVKLLASSFVKNPIDFDGPIDILWMLIGVKNNALGAMWFINVTLLCMLCYPLYVWVLRRRITTVVLLCILIATYYLFPSHIDIFYLSKTMQMWIYFWAGIVVARYGIDRNLLASPAVFLMLALLFAIMFACGVEGLPLAIVGIIASLILSKCLEHYYPMIFVSFRDYTYPIYLISVFPQMAIEMLFRKMGCQNFVPFFLINIWVGLYFPLLVVWIVRKGNWKWLKVVVGM